MSFVDFAKKHLKLGLISQCAITVIAATITVITMISNTIGDQWSTTKYNTPPSVVYGPPPTPTSILSPTPIGGSGSIDHGSLLTSSNMVTLVSLGSLLLYAWAVLGWVFWGGIMYLKMREK
ncbi:MAG TPA: hypothetical protein VK436_06520 [Methanocella sp.]|nr:hypothetical protein [Methanocella sp.]